MQKQGIICDLYIHTNKHYKVENGLKTRNPLSGMRIDNTVQKQMNRSFTSFEGTISAFTSQSKLVDKFAGGIYSSGS